MRRTLQLWQMLTDYQKVMAGEGNVVGELGGEGSYRHISQAGAFEDIPSDPPLRSSLLFSLTCTFQSPPHPPGHC